MSRCAGGRQVPASIGIGCNEIEFTGLNKNFHNRGRRSEEQAEVMQALRAEPHVTFKGRWHNIEDAGINPRPAARKVPLWYGGHAEVTLPRVVKWGDGWMPLAYAPRARRRKPCLPHCGATPRKQPRPGDDRHRHAGLGRRRQRSRVARGSAVLEVA